MFSHKFFIIVLTVLEMTLLSWLIKCENWWTQSLNLLSALVLSVGIKCKKSANCPMQFPHNGVDFPYQNNVMLWMENFNSCQFVLVQKQHAMFSFLKKFFFFEKESTSGGGAEGEVQKIWSRFCVDSSRLMWGSNSWTMRSWPELKSGTQLTESSRCSKGFIFK